MRHLSLVTLLVLAGCSAPLPTTSVPDAPLTAEEQAVADAIADVSAASREAFDQEVAGNPEQVQPAYHVQAAAPVDPPQATVEDGSYAGPFPAAASLPAGYQVRTPGGWLQLNPTTRQSDAGVETVSTYWTPGGTTQASAAQTIQARLGGTLIQDLYVSPNTEVTDLPAFFKDKLSLPAHYQVLQAEETYQAYTNGSLAGPATGYRWLVLDGDRQAWVRALHLASGANHYNVSANYQAVGGTLTPLHTAYATQLAGSGIGYGFQRDVDLATGRVSGKGSWSDASSKAALELQEVAEPDGTVKRTLTRTLPFGEVLSLTETYAPHSRAGTGSIVINDVEVGSMSWDTKFKGSMKIQDHTAPYTASRSGAAQRPAAMGITMRVAITDYPSPAPSEAPTPEPTPAPTATPTAPTATPAPTARPTHRPCPTPTPWLRSPSLSPITRARFNIHIPIERR